MAKMTKPVDPPRDWAKLKYHPLSEVCDFGVGIDLDALIADMQNRGYDPIEPIILFQEMILDGRHKHVGAVKAEVVPTFAEFTGDYSAALNYSLRRKTSRQHLDTTQRAMLAANILKLNKNGEFANLRSQAEAAAALNVSPRSVHDAAKVLENGTEKLRKAASSGTLKVSVAAAALEEDEETQDEIAALSEPAKCANCKKRGSRLRNCPDCAEAEKKRDKKAARNGLKKKGKNKACAAKPLSWNWFEKQVAEMTRFLWELKVKDKDHRERVTQKVTHLANAAKSFRYSEEGK